MTRKIRHQPSKGGKHIKAPEPAVNTDKETPAFCLRHLDKPHSLEQCSVDEKAALVDQMRVLGQMTWIEIKGSGRHGAGTELIARTSIKRPIPAHVTDDVAFLALRFDGKKPMIGYRIGRIFHIVWLDRDFTVYPH
jgi:hypothetical protein